MCFEYMFKRDMCFEYMLKRDMCLHDEKKDVCKCRKKTCVYMLKRDVF